MDILVHCYKWNGRLTGDAYAVVKLQMVDRQLPPKGTIMNFWVDDKYLSFKVFGYRMVYNRERKNVEIQIRVVKRLWWNQI